MTEQLSNLDVCNHVIGLKKDIEKNFLSLGEYLKGIRDGRLYEPQWGTFEEYLWELDMSDTTASKLINIFEKFVIEFKFTAEQLSSPKGWSSLAEALPLINSKEDAEHYVHLRDTLRAKDYREQVRSVKKGSNIDTCSHANTYLIRVCRDCGYKHQEFNEKD